MLDRHDLYELCVQTPVEMVPLLVAIHGAAPRVFGEDFSATAALSRAWLDLVPDSSAIAVDHDPAVVARIAPREGLLLIEGDVVAATDPRWHAVDLLHCGNFAIGEWHDRAALLAYLQHARARLRDGGVFVCDTYGGDTAFVTGDMECEQPGPDGTVVQYRWEQRDANALTGEVVNALHFTVIRGGEVVLELPNAFVYRWRLWSVPELRDAMDEAGFDRIDVYRKTPDAVDGEGVTYTRPVETSEELEGSFDVFVAARSL